RDVMAELVHENVRRPHAVGGDGAVEAVDAPAAVRGAVHQNLDDVVRRVRGDVAKRLVVEREDVALRVERAVCGAQGRWTINVLRRTRHARLRGGRYQPPDVDVALPLLEWRGAEQRRYETLGVALELRSLARGVAVAEDQQIELLRRLAGFMQFDQRAGVRRLRAPQHEFV